MGITRHQLYYEQKAGKQGRKPSATTQKRDEDNLREADNSEVLNEITAIASDPDTDYGYRKMTFAMMMRGYLINHKKVYRLMKENMLLKEKHQSIKK